MIKDMNDIEKRQEEEATRLRETAASELSKDLGESTPQISPSISTSPSTSTASQVQSSLMSVAGKQTGVASNNFANQSRENRPADSATRLQGAEEIPKNVVEPAPIQGSAMEPGAIAMPASRLAKRPGFKERMGNIGRKVAVGVKEDLGLPTPASAKVSSGVVRTLQADSATYIAKNKVTVTQMALREAEKRRETETAVKKQSRKSWVSIIAASILLAAGAGIVFYFFLMPKDLAIPPEIGSARQGETLIFAENIKTVDVTGLDGRALARELGSQVANANLRIAVAEALVPFSRSAQGETVMTSSDLLYLLESRVPARLIRELDPSFMYGVFSGNKNSGFLVFTTKNFDAVFSDMLAWEPELASDLGLLLSGKDPGRNLTEAGWEDILERNVDTRQLAIDASMRDDKITYGFVNRNTLVIARNVGTFREVLTRFNTPRPVTR